MAGWYIFITTAVMIALSGCGKVEFGRITGAACQGSDQKCVSANGIDSFDYHVQTKSPNYKTDILFIDDNSKSMRPEQDQMAFRFPTFLNSISNLDWRIGIATTDMREGGTGPTQDGKLLQFSGISDFFITASTPNVANVFANTIKRPETGYGDERGIYAALRTLQRAEHNFIREDAHLAVVILSDEDERSSGGSAPANEGGPLVDGKDYPQNLIDYVNSTWAFNKNLTVHSIIVKPDDVTCYNEQKSQEAGAGTANFGKTYASLSQLTGGVLGTVCASDYGSQLSSIGDIIQQTTSSITLACVPLAGTLKVSGATGWTQSADKLNFDPPLPAGTDIGLSYQCETR